MKNGFCIKALVGASVLAASAASMALPTNFSFNGTFVRDDNVQLFNFTADGTSTVSLVSYGYAGGTQSNGAVVTFTRIPEPATVSLLAAALGAGFLARRRRPSKV